MGRRGRWGAALLCALMLTPTAGRAQQTEMKKTPDMPLESGVPAALSSPSLLLMEAESGQVIFERNADERRPAASVTKIMTILLTLEAIDEGRLDAQAQVTVSPQAAGMGGSQVFLEAGERYRVSDLLGSVIIASANDAATALAECIDGTQEAFVRRMNERAKEEGLTGTQYRNCTGLPAPGQYTTARDVARLSRLLDRHPMYYSYSTVWMDELKHRGGRVTQLTNTNRLIRTYPGCDGYKTGSTNEARYCISATAKKDGMRLIAVVLGAEAGQTRFDEARTMLQYGFAGYERYTAAEAGDLTGVRVPVQLGGEEDVEIAAGGDASLLLRKGDRSRVRLHVQPQEGLRAPISKGDVIGRIDVLLGDEVIGSMDAVSARDVALPGLISALLKIRDGFWLGQ